MPERQPQPPNSPLARRVEGGFAGEVRPCCLSEASSGPAGESGWSEGSPKGRGSGARFFAYFLVSRIRSSPQFSEPSAHARMARFASDVVVQQESTNRGQTTFSRTAHDCSTDSNYSPPQRMTTAFVAFCLRLNATYEALNQRRNA